MPANEEAEGRTKAQREPVVVVALDSEEPRDKQVVTFGDEKVVVFDQVPSPVTSFFFSFFFYTGVVQLS